MSRSSVLFLLLLAGCGSASEEGFQGFDEGSPEELAVAEERALAALFAADGAAALAGVEGVDVLRVAVDDLAMAHARVRQTIGGVPVWGGEAVVHLAQDGSVFGITDDFVPDVAVDTAPAWAADEAIDLAVELYAGGWDAQTEEPAADLWVLRDEGRDHLVWRVQLEEMVGDVHDGHPVVFVDAHTGEGVWQYDNLQTASCTGTTNFYGDVGLDCYTDGTRWYTEDTVERLGTYSYNNTTTSLYYVSSTSTAFPTSSYLYTNAVEAAWGLQKAYTYYDVAHDRDGIDGAGGPFSVTSHGTSFISARTSYSRDYVNAFWSSSGKYLVFGDGDGSRAGSLTALDIVGHEYTHGVTQFEANLTYSGESGHLNESTSDIFGALVERAALGPSADNWLIGEDTWTPATPDDALRYMNDPAADGKSWDYYGAGIGSVDVHYGSGVPNLAFYLMAEGGSHPRGKSNVVVDGMGTADAGAIWYLALSSYMTSSTNIAGARAATLQAATALFGASSAQVATVADAWAAVGVGSPADGDGGGGSACTTEAFTGSIASRKGTAYVPTSAGTAVSGTSQEVALAGPSNADFDLYLDRHNGRRWGIVASSATRGTATESLTWTGDAGNYRVRVVSRSGTGAFIVDWCK